MLGKNSLFYFFLIFFLRNNLKTKRVNKSNDEISSFIIIKKEKFQCKKVKKVLKILFLILFIILIKITCSRSLNMANVNSHLLEENKIKIEIKFYILSKEFYNYFRILELNDGLILVFLL